MTKNSAKNKAQTLPNKAALNAEEVYKLLRKIPEGRVTTYGEIAKKLETKAFRAVGKIVGQNRDIPATPCHRVVRADGNISGYAFGVNKKIALLKSEGVNVKNDKIVDFSEKFYSLN
jgi:methylated-DNA-[protein]-cysteine S-methyltransferase